MLFRSLWHGTTLYRDLGTGSIAALPMLGHIVYLVSFAAVGSVLAVRYVSRRLHA